VYCGRSGGLQCKKTVPASRSELALFSCNDALALSLFTIEKLSAMFDFEKLTVYQKAKAFHKKTQN
jgi:hypothetical protein